jgi:GR25 family glycosyltransferase involved in LPS biosynthesis
MLKDLEVFVINLSNDKFKKERIKKIFSKFSFNYNFFKACDGRKKKQVFFKGYNDIKRKLFFGRSLLAKELGIFESHKNILQEIIKNILLKF